MANMRNRSIRQFVRNMLTSLVFIVSVLSLVVVQPLQASAITQDQINVLRQGLVWFNTERDTFCGSPGLSSASANSDYAGNPILTNAQLSAVKSNQPFYEKAATQYGIPWQLLAAVHGRETGFKRYGPANGYGPYQITPSNYPIKDPYTDAEFQDATNKAAALLKDKAGGADLTNVDNVKYVLFSYNGAASVYIQQAKSLGYSDAEAKNGEGSPYVMNRFDLKRDPTVEPTKSNNTWGQIKVDYGSIAYPANSDYGAFLYFIAVSGNLAGTGCDSGGSASALNGDAKSLLAEFASYMKSHGNRYGAYFLGSNGCTTLSTWFTGEHTSLRYGNGNGEGVVRNMVSANPGKGLTITSPEGNVVL